MCKQAVGLCKVDDVDLNAPNEVRRVLHSEVEPLQGFAAVGIVAEPDVVHIFASLPNLLNICRFEVCVEFNYILGSLLFFKFRFAKSELPFLFAVFP